MKASIGLERSPGAFRLTGGDKVALASITRSERLYLEWLECRAQEGESHASILPSVCGPGAFPLGGKGDVDEEVRSRPVFRVAEDLLHRLEHLEAARSTGDEERSDRALYSVTDTAFRLGVSRVAVVKAIQTGRLAAYQMG